MKLLFLVFCFFFAHHNSEHDIHISTCEIYPLDNQKIEVTFKVFYDDLQLAMGLRPGEELPKKYKGSEHLIYEFLQKFTSFSIDGHITKWKYVSSQAALPAVWTTIVIEDSKISSAKSLTVTNRILIDQYSDQLNIIHSYIPSDKKTIKLDKKIISATINL